MMEKIHVPKICCVALHCIAFRFVQTDHRQVGPVSSQYEFLNHKIQLVKENAACEASVPVRRAFSVFWPRANWSGSKRGRQSRLWKFGEISSHRNACYGGYKKSKIKLPWNHQDRSNQAAYHISDIPWTQSLLC